MKLIFIYGPPAAGKYTIGKKLAGLTGFKFFHNHLTVDVVRALFEDDDPRRNRLIEDLRVRVIQDAAKYDFDTIFTHAYTDIVGKQFVPQVIDAVTSHGGTVHFVRLDAPDAVLFERIGNASRAPLGKPTDPRLLHKKIVEEDVRIVIDYSSSLELDTSKLTPEESVRAIIEAFGLPLPQ